MSLSKVGGRKFLVSVLGLACATALHATVGLNTEFVGLVLGIIATFGAGNILEHKVNAAEPSIDSEASQPLIEEVAVLQQRSDALQQALSEQGEALKTLAKILSSKQS